MRHLEGFLEKSEESRPPLKLKNNGGQLFSLGCFFQKIGVSRGLGCNRKIFKKHFLELSYNLVFKNMHHTSELFIFLETGSGTLCVVTQRGNLYFWEKRGYTNTKFIYQLKQQVQYSRSPSLG